MTSSDINTPCPCGSGKPFRQCCLGNMGDRLSAAILRELEGAMKGRTFTDLDELNAFAETHMRVRNAASLPEFQGLSPDDMAAFLYAPFDSSNLITFSESPTGCETAPILRLFLLLAEAIGAEGLKATAKGNLPRGFCQEAARRYWTPEEYEDQTRFQKIGKEEDFMDLHVLRLVAGLAGYLRKYKGRYILSKTCRRLLVEGNVGAVYMGLFRAHAAKFNWGYLDGYPAFPIVQQSFLYTLYLLQRHGNEPQPQSFYEDRFLEAYPAVLGEADQDGWSTPEQQVRRCYSLRAVHRWLPYLGLGAVFGGEGIARDNGEVRALPLLWEIVQFRLQSD